MTFWGWLRCKHAHVRCIHGDEIVLCGFRRRRCLDCGRTLSGDLPARCWYTGQFHLSAYGNAS